MGPRHPAGQDVAQNPIKAMTKRSKGGDRSPGSKRRLAVKLKTAKGRKIGSTRWLQRQLNDPYVAEAKRLGYRSRAAFKLIEIDDKHRLLETGAAVVDLGAAPGGWSQVAAARAQSPDGGGLVVAADVAPIEPLPGVEILQLDIESEDAEARLKAALSGRLADLVLSDMAAPATGHKQTDHLRIIGLVEAAYDIAGRILAPGGSFLAKVLQGGAGQGLVALLSKDFETVRHVKPKASRADSAETYVLAKGFRAPLAGPRTKA
jgi:23S rRNA (uridine2552-2'-O)-methyltransferase